MRFRSDVQGLRAVAVIPVLLFHFGAGWISGGFTGVDIFFCISGYVIAGSVLNDIRANRFTITDFYFKRVRRIFPALGVVLFATTIVAVLLLLSDDLVSYGNSLIATGTFWSNIYFWRASGYFATAAQTRPLLHTWSLSIEEQFYIFAPVGLWLIHRYGRERWLIWLAPVAVASFAASVAAVFYAPTAGFFLLPSRAWELLIGVMIAVHRGQGSMRPLSREVISAVGLVMVAAGLFYLTEADPFPGWYAVLPVGGTALIIMAGRDADRLPFVNRLLSTKPLVWIGNLSYSLYLVHWPIAAFSRYAMLRPPTPIEAAIMFAASILLSALIRRYVEDPLRHVDRRRTRVVLMGGLAMMGVTAAVSVVLIDSGGLPSRHPGFVHQQIAGTAEWGGAKCFNLDTVHTVHWDPAACTRVRGRRGRILLWGDSFAAQYAPGIRRNAQRIDADVLQYTFAGCPPILAYYSMARPSCTPFNRAVLDVIAREHIDTVVLSARWSETPRHTILRLQDTVSTLRRHGVRVYVFGQSPEFIADVQQIDFMSGQSRRRRSASWPVSFHRGLNEQVAAQSRGATFVDPTRYLCRHDQCPYRLGTHYLYADYGHFSTIGSAIAVDLFFPRGWRPDDRR